jgi:hypothetical protein
VRAAVGTLRSDVVAPVVHLAENPVRLQYGLAQAARLSYFVSQQAIVSATVDGARGVDPLAVGRAVVAALGNGREEELLEALRIKDDFITSKYAALLCAHCHAVCSAAVGTAVLDRTAVVFGTAVKASLTAILLWLHVLIMGVIECAR